MFNNNARTYVDPAREDRLARNRISAKKCRNKRKAHVSSLQEQVDSLSSENAQLLRENEQLAALVARLQGSQGTQLITNDVQPLKRFKRENGVTNSFDSSESAVFATSPQMEKPLLAMVTTVLCSAIAGLTSHTIKRAQGALPTLPAHPLRAALEAAAGPLPHRSPITHSQRRMSRSSAGRRCLARRMGGSRAGLRPSTWTSATCSWTSGEGGSVTCEGTCVAEGDTRGADTHRGTTSVSVRVKQREQRGKERQLDLLETTINSGLHRLRLHGAAPAVAA